MGIMIIMIIMITIMITIMVITAYGATLALTPGY